MKALRLLALVFLAGTSTLRAFDFSYNSGGIPQHWNFVVPDAGISTNVFDQNTHAIRYFISSDGWSTTNTAMELNAIRNAFGQWQSIPNTVIKFEEGGFVASGYRTNETDNTNVIYWAKTSTLNQDDITGALGVTYKTFSVASNVVQQFDIVLNGWQYGWFTDFNDSNNTNFFVESTLCHEIGHALGLNHTCIGGATMLYAGQAGVDSQAGLSVDEVAFAHALYPASNVLSTLGNLKGTVTKNGSPVFGAAVAIEDTNGNLAGGTVTLTNGTYILNALSPGNYNVRVYPLDTAGANGWLVTGSEIAAQFNSADTSFLPYPNTPVTLTANTTNTQDFAVTNGTTPYRITYIRAATSNPNSYSWVGLPVTMQVGQSNMYVGVAAPNLPTNGATLSITGNGLTVGATSFITLVGYNFITVPISIASNATPGLRTFVLFDGTNRVYANGFLDVQPAVPDYNFDGLDDRFQRKYFFPFTSAAAAPGADPDGDGVINSQEYLAGTNPTNVLLMARISRSPSGAMITWLSATNHHYQVMARTNVSVGTWQNIGSVLTPTGTNTSYLDSTATNGAKYYRVEVLP